VNFGLVIEAIARLASGDPFRMPRHPRVFMSLAHYNSIVRQHIVFIEMVGVLMRIFSFSLVSWLGPASPFLFVWIFNTVDAVMLSWCSILKRDRAYTILNVFWILVGVVGILRASRFGH
jgi:hypothetical protein